MVDESERPGRRQTDSQTDERTCDAVILVLSIATAEEEVARQPPAKREEDLVRNERERVREEEETNIPPP